MAHAKIFIMATTLQQPTIPSAPQSLSDEQLAQFQENGYLAFTDLLSAAETEAARDAMTDLIHNIVIGENSGVFHGPTPENPKLQPFYQRHEEAFFIQLERGFEPERKNVEEIELGVRKLHAFGNAHPFYEQLLGSHPRLNGIIESLIGADAIRFQDMALIKPPFIGSEKPWHQDNAYFSVTPLNSIVGVWIALDDAKAENGCMHVIPGGHELGAMRHHHTSDCEIMPNRLDTSGAVPVELPAGGAMFFYGMLPHETPPNRSPHRRRALQFHYRSAASKIVEKPEYDTVFCEADGTPASCKAAKG